MTDLDQIRIHITQQLRHIRKKHGWTQQNMADLLQLSQSRYSEIEQSKGSLSAEQLVALLKEFGLSIEEISGSQNQDPDFQLRAALSRMGAPHLSEPAPVLLSSQLSTVYDVILETLVRAPKREFVSALAPILARHAQILNLDALGMKLYDLGIDGRLWWMVEGTLWAIRDRLKWHLPPALMDAYRSAGELLALKSKSATLFFSLRKAYPSDILDQDIHSQASYEKTRLGRDPLATRWRVITAIRSEDFTKALEDAEFINLKEEPLVEETQEQPDFELAKVFSLT